jgi:hypothetical protein
VCDQETSKNEEAKARYRAVENTTTMGCNARKTNKQTTSVCNILILSIMKSEMIKHVYCSSCKSVAYPGIFFRGFQQIQLRTEDRENGDLGLVAP